MKYFTTPAAEDYSLEEAFTLVCLRERCDIAGIIRNVTPLVESIYAKISKKAWLEIVTRMHDEHVLFYSKDTIVLADSPYSCNSRNHAISALAAIAALPQTILYNQAATPVLVSLITKIGTEVKGQPIPVPQALQSLAQYAIQMHRDAIGMHRDASGCHRDASECIDMHPHLNNININFNFNFKFNSSPSTPPHSGGSHRNGLAGGEPPAPPRKEEEEEKRRESPGGQAPQTPQGRADWNGVMLTEKEAERLRAKYPHLDLIDLTQEVADYYETKGEEIKHPYQACVKWAEKKEAK